jgi:hypothetical protein
VADHFKHRKEKTAMSKVKSNDSEATLRKSTLPKSQKVVQAKEHPGACLAAGRRQLANDGDKDALSVIPNGKVNGKRRIPNPPKTGGQN